MKRDTIKSLAAEIRALWPELDVRVERGYCDTDRKIPGTRLRRPGKGRWGSRIIVRDPAQPTPPFGLGRMILDHNNAETYRTTSEVRAWIEDRIFRVGRGGKGRRK